MKLELWQLTFDFALVVLIWLVQLIIYPSFKYIPRHDLLNWHQRYVKRMGIIVVPLMLGQVALMSLQVFKQISSYSVGVLLLVLVQWIITLSFFAPMHQKISSDKYSEENLNQLVKTNWIRTVVYTIIFLWGSMKESGLLPS
ncbi:hypothetical protein B0O79_3707 [Flavobacteriaceae bacterium MAR_2009_75]|nr:hypothetical protein B0O79_3707 [Flavobacteriaceae bacterium MAR_2009_75]